LPSRPGRERGLWQNSKYHLQSLTEETRNAGLAAITAMGEVFHCLLCAIARAMPLKTGGGITTTRRVRFSGLLIG